MGKSIAARCIDSILMRRRMTPDSAARELCAGHGKTKCDIPRLILFPRKPVLRETDGMQVFEAPGLPGAPAVLYLHGGSYIHPITPFHWLLLDRIARRTGSALCVPDYLKLPAHTHRDSLTAMLSYYSRVARENGARRLVCVGDSAGGGFALTLLLRAKQEGLPLPDQLILLSPWVDVGGGDPAKNRTDVLVHCETVRMFGEAWADGVPLTDPAVSPLYGELTGLPPVELYAGENEVLFDDILLLYRRLVEAGNHAVLHTEKQLGHVYPLFPTPEGFAAGREICRTIGSPQEPIG